MLRPLLVIFREKSESSGDAFLHHAFLNATGANPHALGSTVGQRHSDFLQVRILSLDRHVVGMGNLMPFQITLTTHFTALRHIDLQKP